MSDYYLNDAPLNLAAMEIKHIIKVRAMFPEKSFSFIAAALGIGKLEFEKKLYHYGIRLPDKKQLTTGLIIAPP